MAEEEFGALNELGRSVAFGAEDDSDEGGDEQQELLQRPCLEEFVAANYKAEDYDTHFGKRYGPGWSDPTWTREKADQERAMAALLADLPPLLQVQSRVRHVSTRTARTRHPTRHRFKQYLFADPAKRLVRKRPINITSAQLIAHLDELMEKERAGILTVHMTDGRQLNLAMLKAGTASLAEAKPPVPLYNPPLDSIKNDTPAGIPMPQYVDGTFPGDPAAQRAVERITAEKQHESDRQGPDESKAETPAESQAMGEEQQQLGEEPPAAPMEDAAPPTKAAEDQLEIPVEPTATPEVISETALEELLAEEPEAPVEEAAVVEEVTTEVDPAAARASKSSKKGKGRR